MFSHIIQAFNEYTIATTQRGSNMYNVLLILTDGVIHDMHDVREKIIDTSGLPASIIIVGVGQENFGMMHQLDSDDQLLRGKSGRTAKRDVVQFVEFRECVRKGNLAEEVLREIPD
jgi:hypothetical protein